MCARDGYGGSAATADSEKALLVLLESVAGETLIGAYRHGSATLGGSLPDSDVDVLAVTWRSLDGGLRRALVDGLLELSRPPGTGGRAPLELTVVAQDDVRPWRFPPVRDFQWGEWLRGDPSVPVREPDSDLAVMLTQVLRARVALRGPDPVGVLDPVPEADVVAGMAAAIPRIAAGLSEDPRHGLLALARIWRTLATGEIVRKDEAAAWAAERLDAAHRPVLERVRTLYLSGGGYSATVDLPAVEAAGRVLAWRAAAAIPERFAPPH